MDTNKIYSVGIHEHNHNVTPEMVLYRRERAKTDLILNLISYTLQYIIHTLHCNVKSEVSFDVLNI